VICASLRGDLDELHTYLVRASGGPGRYERGNKCIRTDPAHPGPRCLSGHEHGAESRRTTAKTARWNSQNNRDRQAFANLAFLIARSPLWNAERTEASAPAKPAESGLNYHRTAPDRPACCPRLSPQRRHCPVGNGARRCAGPMAAQQTLAAAFRFSICLGDRLSKRASPL